MGVLAGGFPMLGMLPMAGIAGAMLGRTVRSVRDNPLRNYFFSKPIPVETAKPVVKKPVKEKVLSENLKFKLKITDMMGTTIASKSGKIGKATKSITIRTPSLARSEGMNDRIVANTTPFNIKETRRRVG